MQKDHQLLDPLPGLRPWTPLGDFRPPDGQTPWVWSPKNSLYYTMFKYYQPYSLLHQLLPPTRSTQYMQLR